MNLSIILPVYNEAEHLESQLNALQVFREQGHELIVVDGGSVDSTLAIAQSLITTQDADQLTFQSTSQRVDKVLISQKGRALQMNAGASLATGNVLLFLHADTYLPVSSVNELIRRFSETSSAEKFWGRFDVRLSGSEFSFRIIEKCINLRSRLTAIATGDQAIFIHSALFQRVGNYQEIELMEDVALSKTLKKIAAPVCIRKTVTTSSRRWQKRGVISTVLLMWKLRFLYFLGVSPTRLVRMYR